MDCDEWELMIRHLISGIWVFEETMYFELYTIHFFGGDPMISVYCALMW